VEPLTTSDPRPALHGTVSSITATVKVTIASNGYTTTNNGDGTWTLADDTIAPPLNDGSYDVTVTASDAAGNVERVTIKDALLISSEIQETAETLFLPYILRQDSQSE
jgi:hypothetical protein